MGALNTFFSWRGAHHGKATGRAVREQSSLFLGAERARWRAEHPGQPYPRELMTIAEQNGATLAGHGQPITPPLWWTLVVLAVLCACTIVGLVVSVPLAVVLYARSPYRGGAPLPAARTLRHDEVRVHWDPPTVPLVTVPDPVRMHRLPQPSGRHARP